MIARRGAFGFAVPVAAGLGLGLAVGAAGFAIQSVLPTPKTVDLVGSQLLQSLQHVDGVRSVETLGLGHVRTSCLSLHKQDVLRVGRRTFVVVTFGRRHTGLYAPGTHMSTLTAPEADLAACPDVLRGELADRLMSPAGLRATAVVWHHLPALRIHLKVDRPYVSLVVTRRSLVPVAVVYSGSHVHGSSRIHVHGGAS